MSNPRSDNLSEEKNDALNSSVITEKMRKIKELLEAYQASLDQKMLKFAKASHGISNEPEKERMLELFHQNSSFPTQHSSGYEGILEDDYFRGLKRKWEEVNELKDHVNLLSSQEVISSKDMQDFIYEYHKAESWVAAHRDKISLKFRTEGYTVWQQISEVIPEVKEVSLYPEEYVTYLMEKIKKLPLAECRAIIPQFDVKDFSHESFMSFGLHSMLVNLQNYEAKLLGSKALPAFAILQKYAYTASVFANGKIDERKAGLFEDIIVAHRDAVHLGKSAGQKCFDTIHAVYPAVKENLNYKLGKIQAMLIKYQKYLNTQNANDYLLRQKEATILQLLLAIPQDIDFAKNPASFNEILRKISENKEQITRARSSYAWFSPFKSEGQKMWDEMERVVPELKTITSNEKNIPMRSI